MFLTSSHPPGANAFTRRPDSNTKKRDSRGGCVFGYQHNDTTMREGAAPEWRQVASMNLFCRWLDLCVSARCIKSRFNFCRRV